MDLNRAFSPSKRLESRNAFPWGCVKLGMMSSPRAILPAILLALAACSEPTEPALQTLKEGDRVTPISTADRPGIPPIDAAVAATLETATFALG